MSFTNRTSAALLNSLFGNTSDFGALATAPTMHVALSTTAPNEDGTGITEPVGNGYARVATAPADWNSATSADPSVLSNANAITFPQSTGSWGTVTHFVLFDALSGGNAVITAALGASQTIGADTTASFAAGALQATLT